MGEVYEVEDLELQVRVAFKTVRPERAAGPEALQRFQREVLLSRSVTHPHVYRIYDLGRHRESEVLFLTMELFQGDTLLERIRRRGRLDCDEALALVRQVGEALEAAHRAGVIHRDLKSANVIVVGGPRASGRCSWTSGSPWLMPLERARRTGGALRLLPATASGGQSER
jgi:serine/threonine protein kinase